MTSRQVVIRNSVSEMARVSAAIDSLTAELALPTRVFEQLQVAVDEIVGNVIRYAWPEGGAHEISIALRADDLRITVEVVDDGRRFNPMAAKAAPVVHGAPVQLGGRGLTMAKQLVDDITYQRRDGHNRTTLVKNIRMPGKC